MRTLFNENLSQNMCVALFTVSASNPGLDITCGPVTVSVVCGLVSVTVSVEGMRMSANN